MNFCSDEFWNSSLTWYTENPNLTLCFRNTALTWLPCAILWLAAPIWFHHLKSHTPKLIPKVKEKEVKLIDRLTFLFCSKVLLTLVLFINILGEITLRVEDAKERGDQVSQSDILYSVCLAVTYCLSLMMNCFEKKFFFRTSPPLTVFWTLLFICSVPTFKVDVEAW
jgi:ATP-binding cassette subfamily C (CFTR/MRP) protein 1